MKTYHYIFLIALMLPSLCAFSQNESKREILDELSLRLTTEYETEYAKAEAKALEMGWPLYGLVRLDEDGRPLYYETTNSVAAATTATDILRFNREVYGEGMTIGMWECCNVGSIEGGAPFLTHQDFGDRITIADNMPPSSYQQHASHVAGTLMGESPTGGNSTGMAYKAKMDAYGVANDSGEMATAGASTIDEVSDGKLLVSNHSYGFSAGWNPVVAGNQLIGYDWGGPVNQFIQGGFDPNFGSYGGPALVWDTIGMNAEYYLICKSAGNDRSNNPVTGQNVRLAGATNWVSYSTNNHPLGDGVYFNNGYNTMVTNSNAKNILSVGAVNANKAMSNFSGWGPTDDGRIKPDICGMGVSLNSCDTIVNGYVALSGTSMASPNVAGSLLLLQEYYRDMYKVGDDSLFMKSATLKALAINTAEDLGNNGPDYSFGFGVLDADEAGIAISEDAWEFGSSNTTIIEDSIMSVNDVYDFSINYDGNDELYITMVYHDHPADTLVNDLDLRLIQVATGGVFTPYTLDPANPNNDAVKGDNDIDNVEHMDWQNLGNPLTGKYIVRVQVEDPDTLYLNEPVKFSLVIRGTDFACPSSVQHKMLDLPSKIYPAQDYIKSQAKLVTAGRQIDYRTNGRIELKPGFHAKAQTSSGAGWFKTSSGTCTP